MIYLCVILYLLGMIMAATLNEAAVIIHKREIAKPALVIFIVFWPIPALLLLKD